MRKKIQLPKEQIVDVDELVDGTDVEGHRARHGEPDGLSRRMPSSGGELSPLSPSTGGDVTGDDDERSGKR